MERTNPFNATYELCNAHDSNQKNANLPEFPRLLDVEITNHCNFRCLMCHTGTNSSRRKRGYMEDAVYERLLEEIKPHKTPLRFIGWGEPTLHPSWLKYMIQAKKNGSLVHFNTNGSIIEQDDMKKVVDAGIDSIKFSFQGINRETYAEMRNKDYFLQLKEKIKQLYSIRGNNLTPFIHAASTTTYETKEQIDEFKKEFATFTDLVTVGRTVLDHLELDEIKIDIETRERLANLIQKESVKKVHPECPEVFDKMSVNWNGEITACCADYNDYMVLGSIEKQPLKSIWKNSVMQNYRKILIAMQHDKLPLCRHCWDIYA